MVNIGEKHFCPITLNKYFGAIYPSLLQRNKISHMFQKYRKYQNFGYIFENIDNMTDLVGVYNTKTFNTPSKSLCLKTKTRNARWSQPRKIENVKHSKC